MDATETDFYQPTPKELQVWKVCDSLFAEKRRITYQSIGERLLSLGLKRGSNTDICRYLASWKKHHYPETVTKKANVSPAPSPKSSSDKPSNEALAYIAKYLKAFHHNLKELNESQCKLLDAIERSETSPRSKSSAQDNSATVPLLIDMIKKQQARETHYLKALEHAREIQLVLKRELEKYQREESSTVEPSKEEQAQEAFNPEADAQVDMFDF